MNFLVQKVEKCESCHKDFLYFGDAVHDDGDEHYFCSPDCIEKAAR